MTTVQTAQSDILIDIFQGLKKENTDVRLESAIKLQHHVAFMATNMTSDVVWKLWENIINVQLFELMHSQIISEAFGGLLAIDQSLDIGESIEEHTRHLFRFHNYVKSLLPHADFDLMVAASNTFERIVKIGGATFGQRSMDYEVRAAIQLLDPIMQETSRYAGVLILNELAQSNPACFYSQIDLIFDNILYPLKDTLLAIRERAAELLAVCLKMILHQERELHPNPHLVQILQDAQIGLEQPHPEIIHGSLLTYRELLFHGGMFMENNSLLITDQLLRLESHRDLLIQQMAVVLISIIATYDTQSL